MASIARSWASIWRSSKPTSSSPWTAGGVGACFAPGRLFQSGGGGGGSSVVACCFRFDRFIEAPNDVLEGAALERELKLQDVQIAVGAADAEDGVAEL